MQDTKEEQDTGALRDITNQAENDYFFTSYDHFKETYTTKLIGRRTQCTPEIAQQIGELMFAGLGITDAANAVGVSVRAVNNWINRGMAEVERLSLLKEQDLHVQFKFGEEQYVYFYEIYSRAISLRKLSLIQGIRDKGESNWQSDSWLLERLHPDEFGRKTKVEVIDWRTKAIQLIKDGVFSYDDMLKELNDAEEVQGLFESAGVPIISARASETDSNEG